MHYLRRTILLVTLLMAAVLFTACASADSASPATEAAPETSDSGPAAEVPTAEPVEQATEEAAPTEAPAAPTANLTDGCVDNYAEGIDYFPDKIEIQNATGFTIAYHDNYKVVTTLRACGILLA